MALHTIEHQILRTFDTDPRICLAITYASISGPGLLLEAYTADRIEAQLTSQTQTFINDPNKNILRSDRVKLSHVFARFGQYFSQNQSPFSFIHRYSSPRISEHATVHYLPYNWQLNDRTITQP